MLEDFFVKPHTIDTIRGSWIGIPIERYMNWLSENNYSRSSIARRLSKLLQFGEFAKANGAKDWSDLPSHIQAYTDHWVKVHGKNCKTQAALRLVASEASNPVQQMLRIVLPDFIGIDRKQRTQPYRHDCINRFFLFLQEERGLSINTIKLYHGCLRRFDHYLNDVGITDMEYLTPPVISAFVTKSNLSVGKGQLSCICTALRVLFRYLYRERIIDRDLSITVEGPQRYRLSDIPRCIAWNEVRMMLEAVDRRTIVGRRDYAILLLLVTYGLRAREIAALTLDDIDWKRERLSVPERKAGHSTAFPLTPAVGSAIIEYLQRGRPQTQDRHVFFRSMAPQIPMTFAGVSGRASHYLKRAGVLVARPGSHTLRHTCVQRLLDANIPLKTIGDYLGHRSADSTKIYTKIDVNRLRDVALGDGEDVV